MPAAYIALNNEFLALASESLVESGGCLAECDGEGVRVIFGTPLPGTDHAADACQAALALARKLDAFNQRVAAEHGQVCDWRIGVNSGLMIMGSFGGDRLAGFDTRVLAGEADLFGVRVLRLAGLALEAEFGPGREDQLHLLLTVLRLSLAGRSARRLLGIGRRRRRGLRRRLRR